MTVKMSHNAMSDEERALRAHIANDLRLWANEMEQDRKDRAAGVPPPLVELDRYTEMRGFADLVEGGYRGNCSLVCDEGQHDECRRQGCVCECHRQSR